MHYLELNYCTLPLSIVCLNLWYIILSGGWFTLYLHYHSKVFIINCTISCLGRSFSYWHQKSWKLRGGGEFDLISVVSQMAKNLNIREGFKIQPLQTVLNSLKQERKIDSPPIMTTHLPSKLLSPLLPSKYHELHAVCWKNLYGKY